MAGLNDLAPRLRHRVDIQEQGFDVDTETGAQVPGEWVSIRTTDEPELFPAEVVPMSGREFVASNALTSGVTTRITLRRRDGLTASMRVVHDGIAYNIKAVLPDPTLRHHVALMCESGVNLG
jgi:SPP1 family predicted phage head-tail adaptor